MGVISFDRRVEVSKQLISKMNSHVSAFWGRFSSKQFYAWQEDAINSEKKRLEEGLKLKHHKIPYYVLAHFNGYCDSIRDRINREETCFVYRIFNKNYGCFSKDPFPRYDTLPREIWTHPDFGNLGRTVWKSTEFVYYGAGTRDDLPKDPCMVFWCETSVNALFFTIYHLDGTETKGSEPATQETKYSVAMEIAKTYNVSIINMEEI